MRDNKGQLLLLAVVFLAITLIVLASAATVFLNVKQNQMNISFADEYDNIKEKFGFAMNEKANTYNKSGMSKSDAINRSFNETKNDFETLLSYKGFDFDAECIVDDNNVSVNISITSSSQILSESVNYTIVWEGKPPVFRVHAESGDEQITEGAGEVGGSYIQTQADDNDTRNITEDGIGLIDEINYVDENVTTYGTIENFTYAKDEDGNNATLTEEDTGGAKSPDIVTLLPNGTEGVGTANGFETWVGGNPDAWQTNDGDTTYGQGDANNVAQTAHLDNPILTGDINSVTVYAVLRSVAAIENDLGILIYALDGTGVPTAVEGTEFASTLSYAPYSYTWTTNPASGASWTWADINDLEAGIDTDVLTDVRVTQVYAVVDYTPTTAANYELNITFNTTGVLTADNYYLELNYSANGENYDVLVYNSTSDDWDDIGDLTDATMTQKNFTLNASNHYNGGNIRVRYLGKTETGDTSQSTLYIEYHRIRSYTLDYSLNVSYVLDHVNIGDYSNYVLEVRANYSGASSEQFNITYQIDGTGEWHVLGYINSATEQGFTDTLSATPSINVTVRIIDNTTGATPSANTIRIDFIELYCTN